MVSAFQRFPAFQLNFQQEEAEPWRVVVFPQESRVQKPLDKALYLLGLVARDVAPLHTRLMPSRRRQRTQYTPVEYVPI